MRAFSGLAFLAGVLASSGAFAQQGGQGNLVRRRDPSVEAIQERIGRYLNGDEIASVVTPGEPVEYTLNLKAGQVVIAEARSDAFDPALDVVDAQNKILAANDDRYPGDQRPLLLWRCTTDGTYKARIRSFRDRSGGQVFLRIKTYECVDASSGELVEREIDGGEPFLERIPMKAGQLKITPSEMDGSKGYLHFEYNATIAPGGLPDIELGLRLQPAVYGLVAPVDGDYYIMYTPNGASGTRAKVRVGAKEIGPAAFARGSDGYMLKAKPNEPTFAELPVKKGDLLQASVTELGLGTHLVVTDKPNFAKWDISKPDTNPFFPHPNRPDPDDESAVDFLPARNGDGRQLVFRARRDTTLWVATDGSDAHTADFTLQVKPAGRPLPTGAASEAKLRVADHDHWIFDAKPGDVMNLQVQSPEFRGAVVVRDPDLYEIRHVTLGLDQPRENWRMIVQKPGRYIVTVSCVGDGGGGKYSVSRQAFQPKEFSKTNPAKGEISNGEIQVWRFTVTPNDPLLIHWRSSGWTYDAAIYDDQGRPTNFQRTPIDANNQFGILKVNEPTTFVIVLTGTGAKASYTIELGNIPGNTKG